MLESLTVLPWWGYALIFTLLWSVHNESNRHFQVDGTALMVWRSLFTALILLPLTFIVPWPTHPDFYIFLLISGILLSYQEAESFKLSKNYGGLFLSLQSVIWMATAMTLWWVINPASLWEIIQSPMAAGAILMGVTLGVLAQFFLRSRAIPAYKNALNITVRIAVMGGCAVTSIKLAMNHADSLLSAFVWTFLLNMIIAAAGLARFGYDHHRKKTDHAFFYAPAIKAGLMLGFILAIAGPAITLSFAKVPNPGFSNIVTQLTALWLFGYCYLSGKPTNVRAGGLILTVFGVIILIIGTEILRAG